MAGTPNVLSPKSQASKKISVSGLVSPESKQARSSASPSIIVEEPITTAVKKTNITDQSLLKQLESKDTKGTIQVKDDVKLDLASSYIDNESKAQSGDKEDDESIQREDNSKPVLKFQVDEFHLNPNNIDTERGLNPQSMKHA